MNVFTISQTKHTPEIVFDLESEILSFKGVSLPENAFVFFNPLLYWLEQNTPSIKTDIKKLRVIIDLEYLNSSSLKFIVSFVRQCLILTDKNTLTIEWHYDADDDDSVEKANDMSSVLEHPVLLLER